MRVWKVVSLATGAKIGIVSTKARLAHAVIGFSKHGFNCLPYAWA